jgi:phage anti-repressor protein
MAKIIHHHLGLGDHIVCYGLVRFIAEQEPVYLFCKPHNAPTVKAMYKNCNVFIVPISGDHEAAQLQTHPDYRRVGFQNEGEAQFGEEFYKCMNIPYDYRWKYQIHRDLSREQELFDFFKQQDVFIHDDEERGYKIEVKGYRPHITFTRNLMDYGLLIEHAKEVHCIESSFRLYIDYLSPQGKLYLHHNPKKSDRIVPTKHTWEIL